MTSRIGLALFGFGRMGESHAIYFYQTKVCRVYKTTTLKKNKTKKLEDTYNTHERYKNLLHRDYFMAIFIS